MEEWLEKTECMVPTLADMQQTAQGVSAAVKQAGKWVYQSHLIAIVTS